MIMQMKGACLEVAGRVNYRNGLRHMHRLTWSNIPILNHFRARYPDRDPLRVYQRLFGESLVEPCGGTYQWNADRGTYVSSLQGYRLQPKPGPAMAPTLASNDHVASTLLFDQGGLRATLQLTHDPQAENKSD